MSAARLKEAAKVLRERAETALVGGRRDWDLAEHVGAKNIAYAAPPFALAVAKMLDDHASDWEYVVGDSDPPRESAIRLANANARSSLAIADAILGAQS